LSHVLIAFTIEFDNEFEHRMPHRITNGPPTEGPWLVSQVMWSNVVRHLDPDGLTVEALQARARTSRLSLTGLARWGYVVVQPAPAGRPKRDRIVTPTRRCLKARATWRPLPAMIEGRWSNRFGAAAVVALRAALAGVVTQLDEAWPDYLPVVAYGLTAERPLDGPWPAGNPTRHDEVHLTALLSYVLGAFTAEFEAGSAVSLAVAANTLRVLGADGIRPSELPRLTGVSKEAVAMSVGFLEARQLAVVETDSTRSRGKVVRLSPKGLAARRAAGRRLTAIEQGWSSRFGSDVVAELRDALERLVVPADSGGRSPLFDGVEPYPDGWRAAVRPPEVLPHHPTVLHRGGWPDGS
jgi:DNA-binding MarR family transcriptional regulator